MVKVDAAEARRELGTTAKSPRWAISYKFPARQATTRVNDIVVQVGRTGALTPVAVLEPVKLSGTTISRSTLHNEEELRRKDVRVGDFVLIERSGDVIPQVVSVMKERRPPGARSPSPGRPGAPSAARRSSGPRARSSRAASTPRARPGSANRILHFAVAAGHGHRRAGRGGRRPAPRRRARPLHPRPLRPPLRGPRRASSAWARRARATSSTRSRASKDRGLARLLFALGIRHVGERLAQTLAARFGTLDALEAAAGDDLVQVEDVGPKVAESILFFFAQPANRELIRRLAGGGRERPARRRPRRGPSLWPARSSSSPGRSTA
ncbi:MAG: helix-hairpin-helix domain-containing protein [Candidatus Moduliflexus flocculans]|nr:helix-hairpin-helix domain-containing protein [Candidatus Moduliflexus flocculans]